METRTNVEPEQSTTSSPILWQNSEKTVTLLDIPQSISKAQGSNASPSSYHLVSSSPLSAPFQSNEPKSASSRAKLSMNTVDAELHAGYKHLLEQGVADTNEHYNGSWCLSRPYVEEAPRAAKKRKLQTDAQVEDTTPKPEDAKSINGVLEKVITDVVSCASDAVHQLDARHKNELDRRPRYKLKLDDQEAATSRFLSNENSRAATLEVLSTSTEDSWPFHIPPQASFYLGDCADSRSFHSAIRNQAQQTHSRTEFDFILLDPPWPNRSVKRTHKTPGSTYSTSPSLRDIRDLILDTKVDILMADECLVAVWITNKPAVRELVLGEDGIFACWGVELVEEWLWLKTTVYGVPVTPLDALWRKPYEVLLLGRKRKRPTALQNQVIPSPETAVRAKLRVIIGVPDLHSRKPCLKELIEPLMSDQEDYKALEVFARYLVAGWWSWGDECIKFNWEGFWHEERDHTPTDPTMDGKKREMTVYFR